MSSHNGRRGPYYAGSTRRAAGYYGSGNGLFGQRQRLRGGSLFCSFSFLPETAGTETGATAPPTAAQWMDMYSPPTLRR